MRGDGPGGLPESSATAATDLATMLARDHLDAVHTYVLALDRVLVRANDLGIEGARRQLEAVPPPTAGPPVGHLLERKRRELAERFNTARYQHLHLPGLDLDTWLAFFFLAAEMGGSTYVAVDWADLPARAAHRDEVPIEDATRYRNAVREAGRTLADVRELSHLSPDGGTHAALDAATGWLALGGAPWLFQQTLRELDIRCGQAPVDVSLSYDFGREVQEGTGLTVRLVVRNVSPDVLVLEDLTTDHAYDPREVFTHASLGRLVYDTERDRFAYDAIATGVTTTPFRTAVLAPGKERTVVLSLRLLEGGECWRAFMLRYRRFAPDDFYHRAYVPVPGPATSFPPQVIYAPVASLPDPERADLTTVLLAEDVDEPLACCWAYPFHVGRRAFSLAQARGRVPTGSEPVHYSRWQQAWVMRVDEGCALVSPGRVTLYPRVDPRAFIVIDEAEQRVPVRFAEPLLALFRSLPLGVTDWESHALGLSVSLPKLKLTSFFQEAERMGVALGLDENLLGRRTLWVYP